MIFLYVISWITDLLDILEDIGFYGRNWKKTL